MANESKEEVPKSLAMIKSFDSELGLASFLNKVYLNQIKNFFSDEKKALKFLSSVRADVQRNPKLLECTPTSIVNSYMSMAQFGFMPSGISGEGYVLPYNNNKQTPDGKWVKVMEAQFQLGYQGLVTLFYQAGVERITSGIVRKNDKFSLINGELRHEIDLNMSNKERGEELGAYVKIFFRGIENVKYMNIKDILSHGARFSKSYDLKGKYSPWNSDNDPEGWMKVKTVLKQMSKLMPKNETINRAIDLDNQDSNIADRLESAKLESKSLEMGNLLDKPNDNKTKNKKEEDKKVSEDGPASTEDSETNLFDQGGN